MVTVLLVNIKLANRRVGISTVLCVVPMLIGCINLIMDFVAHMSSWRIDSNWCLKVHMVNKIPWQINHGLTRPNLIRELNARSIYEGEKKKELEDLG